MEDGDFYAHEKSVVLSEACEARIEHLSEGGELTVLKEKLPLQKDEASIHIQAPYAYYITNIYYIMLYIYLQYDDSDDIFIHIHLEAAQKAV